MLQLSEGFVKIGQLSSFPAGLMRKVQVNGENVLVTNVGGKIYAMTDTCTHRGCSLSKGKIDRTVVTCPCHGGRFDIITGKVIGPPPKRDAALFEVQVQGSDVLVKKA